MKKFLICAAATIVALAACTKTEVTETNRQEISIRPINSVLTKAGTSAYVGTLGVYAYDTIADGVLFDNIEFKKGEGAEDPWRGTLPQYWPAGNTVRFTVYGPYNQGVELQNGVITYNNLPAPLDFLYGAQVYESSKTTADGKPIGVNLKHAKCKVKFTAKCEVDNAVTIKSITLTSAATTGSLVITYDGVNINPNQIWNRAPALGEVGITGISQFKVPTSPTQVGSEMFLIPNDTNNITPDNTAKGNCTIVYQLANQANDLTASRTLTGTWEKGKAYTYNLIFDSGEITFNATVDDWDPETITPETIK